MEETSLIKLNVGGTFYTTTRATLLSSASSLFENILNSKPALCPDDDIDSLGYYFIDRDGELFTHIINYLRCGEVNLPVDFRKFDQLISEARFFKLNSLVKELKTKRGPRVEHGKYFNVVEVVEAAHPEKIGVCRSRVTLTEQLQNKKPFRDVLAKADYEPETCSGPCGRFWIQTNITRLKWAELLKAHGWYFMGTMSINRAIPDVTGETTDLCHVIEKWCLVEEV